MINEYGECDFAAAATVLAILFGAAGWFEIIKNIRKPSLFLMRKEVFSLIMITAMKIRRTIKLEEGTYDYVDKETIKIKLINGKTMTAKLNAKTETIDIDSVRGEPLTLKLDTNKIKYYYCGQIRKFAMKIIL